jgi:hypothetical protein
VKSGYEYHTNGLVRIAKVKWALSGYTGYYIEEREGGRKDGNWIRIQCPWDYLNNARIAMREIATSQEKEE